MMRLTFLMLLGNAIFYLIQAVSCCRILTRRFSWPVMVLGFAVGYLLFVTPAIPFPETGMIRGVIALVSFPLVDMVLFRDDLSAHSGAADLLCHLPVGVGVFPVDVHPADEPL